MKRLDCDDLQSQKRNPIYAGLGLYPALVDEETWVRTAAQMIKKEGSEQFLVNMLYVLRQSLGTGVSGLEDHEGD
jgi:hypothetical protein